VAWDKPTAKAILRESGIATPDWVTLPHSTFSELGAQTLLDHIVSRLGMPLMVKPAQGGSGLGVHAVPSAETLPAAMVGAFAYGSTALVERFVDGVDIAVSVLDLGDGPQPLPPVEIVPPDGNYDYAARYTAGITTWHCPARLPEAVRDEVARIAVATHTALGLRDLSRIDMIVAPDGDIQVLEANVTPGMTETSLLPMAVEAAGLNLGSVLQTLVTAATARGR
jgi:D-alanine-D-alanine ligase